MPAKKRVTPTTRTTAPQAERLSAEEFNASMTLLELTGIEAKWKSRVSEMTEIQMVTGIIATALKREGMKDPDAWNTAFNMTQTEVEAFFPDADTEADQVPKA